MLTRMCSAGRAGAHPYRRRLAIPDIRDPGQFLVDLRFLGSSSGAACNAPPTLRATQVYQTFLSLLPFAFSRVFRGQLFLIGLPILRFKPLRFVLWAQPRLLVQEEA